MNALERSAAAFDLPAPRRRGMDYCIASSPHSGSELLSEALWAVGSAGAPHEYFERGAMAHCAERWGVGTIDGYVRALRKHRTARGGVFGFAAHYHQFEDQIGEDLMACHFGAVRPILLRRRNRLEQAVAWSQAVQLERAVREGAGGSPPRFDAEQIEDLIEQIGFEERGWRSYFASLDIVPHEVVYEDLLADYEGTIRGVFDFLELPASGRIELPRSLEERKRPPVIWAWRFRKEMRVPQRAARVAATPRTTAALTPPTRLPVRQRSEQLG